MITWAKKIMITTNEHLEMLKFSNIIHENAEHISNLYLAQDSEHARCQESSLTSFIVPEKLSIFQQNYH